MGKAKEAAPRENVPVRRFWCGFQSLEISLRTHGRPRVFLKGDEKRGKAAASPLAFGGMGLKGTLIAGRGNDSSGRPESVHRAPMKRLCPVDFFPGSAGNGRLPCRPKRFPYPRARLKPSAERAMTSSSTQNARRKWPGPPKPEPGTARMRSSRSLLTKATSSPPGAFGKK